MSRRGQSITEFILMLVVFTGIGLLVFKLLSGDLTGGRGNIAAMRQNGSQKIATEKD
jgi:hypothetical protein